MIGHNEEDQLMLEEHHTYEHLVKYCTCVVYLAVIV